MHSNFNRNKNTSAKRSSGGKNTGAATRKQTAGRTAPVRAKTVSGEPMSRDEVRSVKNMERRKKRRRNRLIIYAVSVIAVIVVAVVLSLTVFFKISSINIAGDEIYSSSQVIEASGLKTGENLFTFSKAEVESNIVTKLPYVESVSIKRSPTGKVSFTLKAAKAMLAIDMGDSYILMSPSCKLLEDNIQSLGEDAITVKASELVDRTLGGTAKFKNENEAELISSVANLITESEIENISEIDVTDQSDIKLGYNRRIVLKVGTVSNFEKNLDFIKATILKNDADEPNFSGVIDFTIENKAFINDAEQQSTTKPSDDGKNDGNDGKKDESATEKKEKTTSESDT